MSAVWPSGESHGRMQWDRLAVMLRQAQSFVSLQTSLSSRSSFGRTGGQYAPCLPDLHTSDPPAPHA